MIPRPFRRHLAAAACALLVLAGGLAARSGVAFAQGSGDAANATGAPAAANPPASEKALSDQIEGAQDDLQAISRTMLSQSLSDAQMGALAARLPPIQAKLAAVMAALSPRLAAVTARLAELGPAPGAGQPPEDPDIAKTRRQLNAFASDVGSDVKQTKLLQVEIGQITDYLANARRRQFTAQLSARTRSILDPRLWTGWVASFPDDARRAADAAGAEASLIAKASARPVNVVVFILALIAAAAIALPARLALQKFGDQRVARLTPPTRLRRTAMAVTTTLVGVLTPLVACDLVRGAFAGAGALTPAAAALAEKLTLAICFAAYFEALGRALLAAKRASWRLAPIPDDVATRLAPYPGLIGLAGGMAVLLRAGATIFDLTPQAVLAHQALAVVLEMLAVGGALAMAGRARREHLAQAVDDLEPKEAESRLPWVLAALVAWLALAAACIALATGYLAFATFVMRNLIWIATVLATLFLLLRLVDDLFPTLLSPEHAPGRFVQMAIGLSTPALEQLAVLASGLLRVVLLLFGWGAILAPFGDSAGDMAGRLAASQLSFRIGQVSISPTTILGAIAVFLVGLFITKAIRGWLEARYLPKTRLDMGLRTSVSAGVTYLGALVAVLVTCGYLGLSLDKIALFASALSVGIGFGLQSVIGNFVSGLILLAERPVKVGDWIAIGDLEGDVRRINVRATEIEMQDRSKLIVPNSDLISKTVRNVTQGHSIGRVRIDLKVADDADPRVVRDLLAKRINAHPDVRDEPKVAIYLLEARNGALEFSCFLYVDTPRFATRVKSELLFQIVPDLRAAGITLANSTPVVNVGLPIDRSMPPETAEASPG